jgi:hypothetical protein
MNTEMKTVVLISDMDWTDFSHQGSKRTEHSKLCSSSRLIRGTESFVHSLLRQGLGYSYPTMRGGGVLKGSSC